MKKHLLLASVSIIAALATSGAFAADNVNNQTNIDQAGHNGLVTINQSGNRNTAGTATAARSGSSNAVNIMQSGRH